MINRANQEVEKNEIIIDNNKATSQYFCNLLIGM